MEYIRDYHTIVLPPSLHGPAAVLTTATSHIHGTVRHLLAHVSSSPDIASIALLLLLLFLSLKILGLLWRAFISWTLFALRAAMYASLAAVGLWVWRRGIEGAASDVEWAIGVWGREYGYWRERERMGASGAFGDGRERWARAARAGGRLR